MGNFYSPVQTTRFCNICKNNTQIRNLFSAGNFAGSLRKAAFLVPVLVLFAANFVAAQHLVQKPGDDIQKLLQYYDKQIYFTENKGQWPENVLYRAAFPLGQAIATKEGMIIGTFDPAAKAARAAWEMRQEEAQAKHLPFSEPLPGLKGHGWLMNFVAGSASMSIESKFKHPDNFNYFIGDASKHASDVGNYQEVWYKNVYDNIDVRYYPSAQGTLEYDIVCKPGSNKNNIGIQMQGIPGVHLKSNGHLVLTTSIYDVDLPAPVAYQIINGQKILVKAKYKLVGNIIKFDLGNYNESQPLIIDPIALRWATWITNNTGGFETTHGHGIWVDQNTGSIYVVGRGDVGLITVNAFQTTMNGEVNNIVGKYLEPDAVGGSGTRVWQTYIGGSGSDNAYAIQQGPSGNVYITGLTSSFDYPLLGGSAFSGSSIDFRGVGSDEIFVTEIDTLGSSIKSSVLGGDGEEESFDLRTTTAGDVLVCGITTSDNLATNFPGSGAVNGNSGGTDVLVFKISQDLSTLLWMRNYGGSGNDGANIMLTNSVTGSIYVAGYTGSTNFPVLSARQATLGGAQDGFVQKLSASGTTLWSSYYRSGSGKTSAILCMEFDATQSGLYFGGVTTGLNASNVSTSGVYQTTYGGGADDFFVGNMDSLQNFIAGTYLGGNNDEVNMMGLNTDLNNAVYVFGYSSSTNFPITSNALQTTNMGGTRDGTFTKMSSDLSTVVYSTFFGGSSDDYDPVGERGIKFSNCRIYTIETSESNNIPLTQGALTTTKLSSTSTYEPALMVWANPPDLLGNTIFGNQVLCSGSVPDTITGSVPSYVLPTISRNGVTSTYPTLGASITYQWQTSTDSVNWNNLAGATSQNLPGQLLGHISQKTYIRRIIGGDACVLSGPSDQVVTINLDAPNLVCGNGGVLSCNINSVTLHVTSDTGVTIVWSGPGIVGSNTGDSVVVNSRGTYKVTATNNCSGVSDSCFMQVTGDTTTPHLVCGPKAEIACSHPIDTLQVSADTGVSFSWSGPGILGSTTGSSVRVDAGGNYQVTATSNESGCSQTCEMSVMEDTGIATPIITGSSSVCTGQETTLDAGPGYGIYKWSNSATTETISVGTGHYSVTVTAGGNGCTASASIDVSVSSPPTVVVTANGPTSVCNGLCVSLTASGASTYLWSSGQTGSTISACATGSYSVTGTNSEGCSASSNSVSVSINTAPVITVTANGPTTVCAPQCVSFTASGASTYLWNNGETTATINACQTNIYEVTGTDANGCTAASNAVNAKIFPVPTVTITANGPLSVCNGLCVSLSAAGASTYVWSTGQTTTAISACTGGNYSVIGTNVYGCTAVSNSVAVSVNVGPVVSVTPVGPTTVCSPQCVTLTASGAATYYWSTGVTTTSISACQTGNYTVTGTDQNGCSSSATSPHVTINTPPTVTITAGGPTTVCAPQCVSFTASGASTYLWSNGQTSSSINACVTNFYTVTGTDANGCTAAATGVNAKINEPPVVTVTANGSTSLCSGQCASLSASGASTYVWSSGQTGSSISACSVGNYSVIGTNIYGCTATSDTVAVTVSQPLVITITANGSTTVCAPQCVSFTASGADNYVWSNGQTTATINACQTNIYTVTGTDANGCSGVSSGANAKINVPPTVIVTANGPTSVCNGSCVSLTASGAHSYVWNSGQTTTSISACARGDYSVTGTDIYGCSAASNSVPVTINQAPVVTITANGSTTVCAPQCVSFTASGAVSYVWSNGQTTTSITACQTNIYTVTGTDANGCTGVSAGANAKINVPPTVTVTANGPTSVCNGSCVSLTASGAHSYVWNGGQTTNPISACTTGNYSVTGTDIYGCSAASNTVAVDINLPPAVTITAGCSTTVCSGQCVPLTASGGVSYVWGNGATTASISACSTGTYSVTGTDAHGCTASSSISVTVSSPPVVTISAGCNTSVCAGQCVPLTASGAHTYLWSNGSTSSSISACSTGTYSVTGTNEHGCTASASISVTVSPPPVVTISAGCNTSVCAGQCVPLTASGAHTYLWSNGSTSSSISACSTGTYSVTGTNEHGCTVSASISVTVSPPPVVTISAGCNTSVCAGQCVPLTASGAHTYLWSNGSTSASISACSSGTYSVTGTNEHGCTASASISVTVSPPPVVTISAGCNTSVCAGQCVPLTASGAHTYLWSNGSTSSSISACSSGTYSVTGTNDHGCTASASIDVTVSPPPVVSISAGCNTTVCAGQCVPLTASGAHTYLWSNGSTSSSISACSSGTYSVTGTNDHGCTASASISVTVSPRPNVTISSGCNPTVCNGQCVPLAASGASTYVWSNGSTSSSISACSSGTYSVTGTNDHGCTASASITVTVSSPPVVTITAGCHTTVCAGQCVPLTASGASTYLWSNGSTSSSISACATGTYSVTGTNDHGCTASASISVTVSPAPAVAITAGCHTTVCSGQCVPLTASGASTYLWSNGSTSSSISACCSGTYTVTGTNSSGCTATASIVITVSSPPSVSISAACHTTVCAGECVPLTASGASTYSWSTGATGASISACHSGTYTVTGTNASGCTATASIVITVSSPPSVSITAACHTTVCEGECVPLTASGASSYHWSTGATSASISACSTGCYTVTGTNSSGCTATATINIVVSAAPVCSLAAPCNLPGCNSCGNSLCASPCSGCTYSWSISAGCGWSITSGQHSSCVTYSAGGSGTEATFTLTITNSSGCSSTCDVTFGTNCGCKLGDFSAPETPLVSNPENLLKEFTMSVSNYPNPFIDQTNFRISSNISTHLEMEIYDLNGRYLKTIYTQNILADQEYSFVMDASDLAGGWYIYRAATDEGTKSGKILLLR